MFFSAGFGEGAKEGDGGGVMITGGKSKYHNGGSLIFQSGFGDQSSSGVAGKTLSSTMSM